MTRLLTRCTLFVALTAVLLASVALPVLACDEEELVEEGPTLNRALIARGVEDHLPLGTDAPFVADGERLYVYLEVDNPGDEEVVYTVVWHHLDRDRTFSQTIEAGHSPRWRTWVYHRMSESRVGQWHVEVFAPGGELQAELDFEVVAPSPVPEVAPPVAGSPDV